MDIYEVDRYMMDLIERYENDEVDDEEIYFLNNLRSDLDNLLS